MDFVIAGFGLGSLFLLLGIAARDLGPRLSSQQPPSTSLSVDPNARPPRQVDLWRKLVPLTGPTMMIGGAILILATFAGIFLKMSDSEGSQLVLGAFVLSVVGVAARLPFQWRARSKPAKPKLSRRPPVPVPVPVRERPRPVRQPRPPVAAAQRPQATRRRSPPEPTVTYQPRRNGRQEEVTDHVAWSSIPDLPDIFDSDEPIQTGLLEKLLAEDDERTRAGSNSEYETELPASGSDYAPRSSSPGRPAV